MVSLKPCQRPLRPPGLTYFFFSITVSSLRDPGTTPRSPMRLDHEVKTSPRRETRCRCISANFLSDPVQMLLVAVAELPLAQRAPFPGLKAAGNVWEKA